MKDSYMIVLCIILSEGLAILVMIKIFDTLSRIYMRIQLYIYKVHVVNMNMFAYH